jgi:glucose/arabinose dehydrogenase
MIPRHPTVLAVLVFIAAGALAVACGDRGGTPTPSPSPIAVGPSASPSTTASASPGPSGPPASGQPFDPARVAVSLEPVVDGLDAPLAVGHAGDGSGRIFVAEQGGTIRIVRDAALVATPFLDIGDRITSGGERGLLGFAFHPDFPDDPRLFVNYTDLNGDTRVSSFEVDPANPDRVDPAAELQLLMIEQPYANHNGGAVVFGPDGNLYIGMGDGGSGGDPHGNGQSLETLLGKILRIDVDGTDGANHYAIPADNPFLGQDGAQREIFLYGLRNPWRISFDPATGDLWIGDVGQNAWEEIDVARAGTSGENYGWNRMEASHCFRPSSDCVREGLTMPAAEYSHDFGCTVIGGYVYRGPAQTALAGGYLFGDYCSGLVWAIDPAADGMQTPVVVAETGLSISSFGEDEAGELYVTDIAGGRLLQVTATTR